MIDKPQDLLEPSPTLVSLTAHDSGPSSGLAKVPTSPNKFQDGAAAAINDGESLYCRFDSGQALLLSGDYSCRVAMPAGRRTKWDFMHGTSLRRRPKRSVAVGRGFVSVSPLPSAVGVDSTPPSSVPMAVPMTLAASFGQAFAQLAAPATGNLCSILRRFSEFSTL